MNVTTQPPVLLSKRSAKETPTKVNNAVELSDLTAYFRREHGHSRRYAGYLARRVYVDEALSLKLLPTGWHEAIYPPAVAYTRRPGRLGELFTPVQHAAWLKAGGDRAK